MYTTQCPHCGIRFNFRASSLGTLHRCNACGGKVFLNPSAASRGCGTQLLIGLAVVVVGIFGFVILLVLLGQSHPSRNSTPDVTSYTYRPAPHREPSPSVAYQRPAPPQPTPQIQPQAAKPLFDTSPAQAQPTPPPTTQPSQLDELNRRLTTAQASVAQAQRTLEDAKRNSAIRLQNDAEYQAAVKDVNDLDAKVKEMREQQSNDIDLSERWMAAKNKLSRLQRDDPTVTAAAANLSEQQKALWLLLAEIADEKRRIASETATATAIKQPDSTDSDNQASQPPPAAGGSYTPGGTYVGPRGGVYHYSKNGNKVYNRR